MHAMFLSEPYAPDTFHGLPYPSLNSSMWTIPYEFRCYLGLALLGLAGILRKRTSFLSLVVLLSIAALIPFDLASRFLGVTLANSIQLTSLFLTGTSFYVFRDYVKYSNGLACIAVALLCGAMFNNTISHTGVSLAGGYLIFWFAFLPNTPRLNRINNSTDISYGLYLYAWPIQNLLIWYEPGIHPPTVMVITTLGAGLLAFVSWHWIEKPALQMKGRAAPKGPEVVPAAVP